MTAVGTLHHTRVTPGSLATSTDHWVMQVSPHVAIRVKRMFPRARQERTTAIIIADTAETSRDLEWLCTRYDLDMDPAVRAHLHRRADEHRATEEQVATILAGSGLQSADFLTPAREPREYQRQAADLAWTTHRLLLGDDLGLGKTMSSLLLLRDPATRPALIVVPTHLPKQWQRELDATFPGLTSHIVTGTRPYSVDCDVLITSYSKLAGWRDHLTGWARTVIFDEVQELRRSGTLKYEAAAAIADKADWKVGASATPVYNYGGEVHSIFSVLAPDALGTREEFVREWGATERNGHVIVKEPRALGEYLRGEGLLLRRTRTEVGRELDQPIRIVENCDADPAALEAVQADVAALAEMILSRAGDHKTRWSAAGQIDWKLRQATGVAKAPYVAAFLRLLLESEQKVVVFAWHRQVYDMLTVALAEYGVAMYTGSESPQQKDRARSEFCTGDARVLLMSLRSGAGLDGLQDVASVAVFAELDWSPEMHAQCIGRLARDGQEHTVAAYFMLSDVGADPVLAEVNELKRQQAEPIRDPDAALVTSASNNADRTRLLAEAVLGARHAPAAASTPGPS